MARIRMHTFHAQHLGRTGKPTWVFKWVDDPLQDYDFLDAMATSGLEGAPILNSALVDRSGPTPVFRWTDHDDNPHEADLVVDQYWHHNMARVGESLAGPNVLSVSGYWRCDPTGRPYDLNDLLSEDA